MPLGEVPEKAMVFAERHSHGLQLSSRPIPINGYYTQNLKPNPPLDVESSKRSCQRQCLLPSELCHSACRKSGEKRFNSFTLFVDICNCNGVLRKLLFDVFLQILLELLVRRNVFGLGLGLRFRPFRVIPASMEEKNV